MCVAGGYTVYPPAHCFRQSRLISQTRNDAVENLLGDSNLQLEPVLPHRAIAYEHPGAQGTPVTLMVVQRHDGMYTKVAQSLSIQLSVNRLFDWCIFRGLVSPSILPGALPFCEDFVERRLEYYLTCLILPSDYRQEANRPRTQSQAQPHPPSPEETHFLIALTE